MKVRGCSRWRLQDLEELRVAVATFVETYNEQWLLEKNNYLSPLELRHRWLKTGTARAAD
jgi:transposase InsO family protein